MKRCADREIKVGAVAGVGVEDRGKLYKTRRQKRTCQKEQSTEEKDRLNQQ